jgi:outer membrane immunogenic protein
MLKTFLPAVLVLALTPMALPVKAADLPRAREPLPAYPAPAFTWTGFHIGYNHGYGGAVFDSSLALGAPALGGGAIRSFDQANGWFGGGQIGYDYQFANGLVLGLETDLQWSDINSSHQAATAASNPLVANYTNASQSLGWFGTTRARLGYSFGRLLPYLTGGVGYGGTSANGAQLFPGGGVVVGNASSTSVGWTAGAGVDIALSERLSARAEYLYVRLPGVSGPAVGLTPPPQQALLGAFSTGATDAYAVRTGMNYRFGGLNDLKPEMEGGLLAFLFQKPELDWTGLHVGVNGGYGGGIVNSVAAVVQPGLVLTNYASDRFGGALAGGQIGYDYQFANQIVAGLETDLQWSGMQSWHQGTTAGAPTTNGFVYTDSTNSLNWFGTTRARLGYARASTLLYVTAGVAYGGLTANVEQLSGALFTGASSKSQVGWTVGSGAEYPLTDKMSLKAEYLYTSFNGINGSSAGIAPAPFPGLLATGRFATQVTRVGLNWRFGGAAPASVATRY